MNYETRLRHFVEEYATALFGSKDITCLIETDEEKVYLLVVENNESKVIMEYDYSKNHGRDETDGAENAKYFFEENPMTFISVKDNSVGGRILNLFGRYCTIFSVNYILADISYLVLSEENPQKDLSIFHNGLSTEYRKINMNASSLQMCVEVYLKDGGLFTQMLIENIEE